MNTSNLPNILLIMSDEHAPMYSGPYGHPLVKTPHLDRLAADGVTFTNAYCNSPPLHAFTDVLYDRSLHSPHRRLGQRDSTPL